MKKLENVFSWLNVYNLDKLSLTPSIEAMVPKFLSKDPISKF